MFVQLKSELSGWQSVKTPTVVSAKLLSLTPDRTADGFDQIAAEQCAGLSVSSEMSALL